MSQGRLEPLFLKAYPASNGTREPIKRFIMRKYSKLAQKSDRPILGPEGGGGKNVRARTSVFFWYLSTRERPCKSTCQHPHQPTH